MSEARTTAMALLALLTSACGSTETPADAATGLDAPLLEDARSGNDAPTEDTGSSTDASLPDDVPRTPIGRDARYCELLLAFPSASAIRVEVWGTQGLND